MPASKSIIYALVYSKTTLHELGYKNIASGVYAKAYEATFGEAESNVESVVKEINDIAKNHDVTIDIVDASETPETYTFLNDKIDNDKISLKQLTGSVDIVIDCLEELQNQQNSASGKEDLNRLTYTFKLLKDKKTSSTPYNFKKVITDILADMKWDESQKRMLLTTIFDNEDIHLVTDINLNNCLVAMLSRNDAFEEQKRLADIVSASVFKLFLTVLKRPELNFYDMIDRLSDFDSMKDKMKDGLSRILIVYELARNPKLNIYRFNKAFNSLTEKERFQFFADAWLHNSLLREIPMLMDSNNGNYIKAFKASSYCRYAVESENLFALKEHIFQCLKFADKELSHEDNLACINELVRAKKILEKAHPDAYVLITHVNYSLAKMLEGRLDSSKEVDNETNKRIEEYLTKAAASIENTLSKSFKLTTKSFLYNDCDENIFKDFPFKSATDAINLVNDAKTITSKSAAGSIPKASVESSAGSSSLGSEEVIEKNDPPEYQRCLHNIIEACESYLRCSKGGKKGKLHAGFLKEKTKEMCNALDNNHESVEDLNLLIKEFIHILKLTFDRRNRYTDFRHDSLANYILTQLENPKEIEVYSTPQNLRSINIESANNALAPLLSHLEMKQEEKPSGTRRSSRI